MKQVPTDMKGELNPEKRSSILELIQCQYCWCWSWRNLVYQSNSFKNEIMVLIDRLAPYPSWGTIWTNVPIYSPIPTDLRIQSSLTIFTALYTTLYIWEYEPHLECTFATDIRQTRRTTILDSRILNATNCLEITKLGLREWGKKAPHFLKNNNISHQRYRPFSSISITVW